MAIRQGSEAIAVAADKGTDFEHWGNLRVETPSGRGGSAGKPLPVRHADMVLGTFVRSL